MERVLVVLLVLLSFAYRANCQDFTSEKIKADSFKEIGDSTVIDFYNDIDSISKKITPFFTFQENYVEVISYSKSAIRRLWILKIFRYQKSSNNLEIIGVDSDDLENESFTPQIKKAPMLINSVLQLTETEKGNFYKQTYIEEGGIIKTTHRKLVFLRENDAPVFGVFFINFDKLKCNDTSEDYPSSIACKFR